ncbi:MAG TPA: c-type cytochrome domain-containing protein [Bacteroidota bacterium]|nr:c-type cytochrome domain-containing protein [Bacteroidota bacterium]
MFPVSNVSYTNHVQPLFNQACNYSGCHDDGAHQSPLKLTSWGNVVITLPGIVVPGKPDASDLVLRIQGTVGARMPPGVNGLNQNQIDGIRAWIVEGAKDN